jgi:Rieske Fe-S protein
MSEKKGVTRRSVLMTIGIVFNGIVGAAIAVPVIGYLLSPIKRKSAYLQWVSLGKVGDFPEGETRLATFENPFEKPQDGETAKTPCWVRRLGPQQFQVFAINCAHLGCPVRWFPQSELFMCPCHGGVYYANGDRASGPPERGMFTYDYKIVKGELQIHAGQMPTLAQLKPGLGKGTSPCLG